MVFSSLSFISVFLPVVLLLHFILPGIRCKNYLLLAASILFYAYGEPVYVLLLVFSAFVNYLFGRLLGNKKSRWTVGLAVTVNISILIIFKYTGFLVSSLNTLTGVQIPVPEIRLPIGISFFTFQALSYVIDVYRGQVPAQKNFAKVLLYISLFPQLVAGPIVRYKDIEKEIDNRHQSLDLVARGMRRFIIGLGKKVLIANTMGAVVDTLFQCDMSCINFVSAWIGAVSYLFQIYFDFSGYSDMAIGMGMMFGFHFRENFNYPYTAGSVQDFWRRWHISLTSWFREYLYFPLGGNRKGKTRTMLNRFIVFLCTGIWHGANVTFLFWGIYHGLFLTLETVLGNRKEPKGKAGKMLAHIYVLLVVCVGFVFFRSETLGQGFLWVKAMFTGFSLGSLAMSTAVSQLTPLYLTTLAAAVLGSTPVLNRIKVWKHWEMAAYMGSLLVLLLCIFSLAGNTYNPFIYFQF